MHYETSVAFPCVTGLASTVERVSFFDDDQRRSDRGSVNRPKRIDCWIGEHDRKIEFEVSYGLGGLFPRVIDALSCAAAMHHLTQNTSVVEWKVSCDSILSDRIRTISKADGRVETAFLLLDADWSGETDICDLLDPMVALAPFHLPIEALDSQRPIKEVSLDGETTMIVTLEKDAFNDFTQIAVQKQLESPNLPSDRCVVCLKNGSTYFIYADFAGQIEMDFDCMVSIALSNIDRYEEKSIKWAGKDVLFKQCSEFPDLKFVKTDQDEVWLLADLEPSFGKFVL